MLESDWLMNVQMCAIIFREMHSERISRQLLNALHIHITSPSDLSYFKVAYSLKQQKNQNFNMKFIYIVIYCIYNKKMKKKKIYKNYIIYINTVHNIYIVHCININNIICVYFFLLYFEFCTTLCVVKFMDNVLAENNKYIFC